MVKKNEKTESAAAVADAPAVEQEEVDLDAMLEVANASDGSAKKKSSSKKATAAQQIAGKTSPQKVITKEAKEAKEAKERERQMKKAMEFADAWAALRDNTEFVSLNGRIAKFDAELRELEVKAEELKSKQREAKEKLAEIYTNGLAKSPLK